MRFRTSASTTKLFLKDIFCKASFTASSITMSALIKRKLLPASSRKNRVFSLFFTLATAYPVALFSSKNSPSSARTNFSCLRVWRTLIFFSLCIMLFDGNCQYPHCSNIGGSSYKNHSVRQPKKLLKSSGLLPRRPYLPFSMDVMARCVILAISANAFWSVPVAKRKKTSLSCCFKKILAKTLKLSSRTLYPPKS